MQGSLTYAFKIACIVTLLTGTATAAGAQGMPECNADRRGPDGSTTPMRTRTFGDARVYSCSYDEERPTNRDNECGVGCSGPARPDTERVTVHAVRVDWHGQTFELVSSIYWRSWPSVRVEQHGAHLAFTIVERSEYFSRHRDTRLIVLGPRAIALDTLLRECEDDGPGWSCSPREPVTWLRNRSVAVGRGADREVTQLR